MLEKISALLFILKIIISSGASFDEPVTNNEFDYSTIAIAKDDGLITPFQFYQMLNHQDIFDNRRFLQNYWVYSTYYRNGGPAFLMINGEHMVDEFHGYGFTNVSLAYAQNLNAIVFSLEHRFYGKTWPENGSLSDLSRAQSLEDIAYFIKSMNNEFHLPKDTKWIVFGCSYGGNLAALSRFMYPHLIFGAIASSAPLISKVDYYEFHQILEESLNSYDPMCVESIRLGFEEIAHLGNSPQNIKYVARLFEYGDDIGNDLDIIKPYIFRIMLAILSIIVRETDASSISIPSICRIMIEFNGTKAEALAEMRKSYQSRDELQGNMPSKKSQDRNSTQDEYSNIQTSERDILETWSYQRCTEFGYFSSYANTTFLSGIKHLLFPIEKQIDLSCGRFFGKNSSVQFLTEKLKHANSQYPGLHYNVSNTIFTHGSLDPWYKTGLYKKSNTTLYESIFIKGKSHCADLYVDLKEDDIPEVKNARIKIFQILRSWLKNNPPD